MRHFWLRCFNDGRKWTHSFHAEDDHDAIAAGGLIVMKLAHFGNAGISDFARRKALDWADGRIELMNELGVIIKEMEAKRA